MEPLRTLLQLFLLLPADEPSLRHLPSNDKDIPPHVSHFFLLFYSFFFRNPPTAFCLPLPFSFRTCVNFGLSLQAYCFRMPGLDVSKVPVALPSFSLDLIYFFTPLLFPRTPLATSDSPFLFLLRVPSSLDFAFPAGSGIARSNRFFTKSPFNPSLPCFRRLACFFFFN